MKKLILAFLLLWASSAYAQFNGCPPGFCGGTGAGGLPANALLSQTGTSIDAAPGSPILVQ